MKTLILILIINFCNVTSSNSQSGWIPQNSNCSNTLLSVSFLNANTGICVGGFGKILLTNNGGLNWDSAISPTQNALLSVYIIDSNTIVACGVDRTIIKTTNFGSNWYRITNIAGGYNLYCVQFIDKYTGFIASESTVILKTTNSGESWFQLYQPFIAAEYYSLSFLDANTGYVVGYGSVPRSPIIKTTNGGLNWIRQESFTTSPLECVKIIDIDTGLISGSFGYIIKTSNGGISWKYINSGVSSTLPSISYASKETIYIVGGNGTIIKSTNGGTNWISQVSGTSDHLSGVSFVNEFTGYAVGSNGTILKTTTGGIVGIILNSNDIPENFSLKQNYPNPFNPVTHIEFSILKNNSYIKLSVFDNTGRNVGDLVNQKLDAGTYTVDFNANDLASGTYFYRIEVNSDNTNSSSYINFTETKSMVLLK